MTTTVGDVAGKITLLRRDLFQIRYPNVFDEDSSRSGRYQALLPVISFILSQFSRHVLAVTASYHLSGRKGKKYIENVFKLAREQFGMQIVLSSAQFLAEGYAERKLMFLHQLIVACREYHSTAVRQERLGVLRQGQHTFSKNQSAPDAAGVLKNQEKKPTDEIKVVQCPSQGPTDHKKVPSTPEEPRQLPKILTASFIQAAEDEAVKEKEKEEELEEIQSIQTEDCCCCYSCIDQCNHDINGAVENKQSPIPAPAPWRDDTILQLFHDTKDISTRTQTLEQRLEQTITQLMNLQTSNKAHMMVLEGRISAVEGGRQYRFAEIITPPEGSFLPATNAHKIYLDNIYDIKNNSSAQKTMLNSPLPNFNNLLLTSELIHAGLPEVDQVPWSHPINFTKVPPNCKSDKEHLNGVEGPKTDCIGAVVDP
ncbi:hypothetical protein Ndes2526B_g09049 [Nannochloris sp. 'desiccata']|nr:putative Centrosomal protein of 44 kDa [Chlorella desiccata (nom. nud.)]